VLTFIDGATITKTTQQRRMVFCYCQWPNRYVFSRPLNALRDKQKVSWW